MQTVDPFGGAGRRTYAQLIEFGRQQGVVVIGWRTPAAEDPVLNPPKEAEVTLTASDRVISIVPA